MAKGTLALRQIQLGDNADTSKNFVISVPAVADGTLTIERENGTDVLTIDVNGNIRAGSSCNLVGNGPAFQAGQSAFTSGVNNTWGLLGFKSEVLDTANCYDPATSKFQPTVAGWYKISATVGGPSATAGIVISAIYKNGLIACFGSTAVNDVNNAISVVTGLIYLNGTTDYVQIYARQNSGSTLNFANVGVFDGFLARAA